MPITPECQRCAACCRWPGEVRLADDEVTKIAAFMKMKERDFTEQHTRLRRDRRGLSLKEQADHSCIFLEDGHCAIQLVKPQQCQEFPNRWVNLLWGKVPLEVMRKEYPMLFVCSAFKDFLKNPPANT